jgi:hypothetical protein
VAVIHIMRAGTWMPSGGRPLTFTSDDLALSAAVYDRERRPAPLTIGHPRDDRPVLGIVDRLVAHGAHMFALVTAVSDACRELVRAGRYRKISASFFTGAAPGNPCPGTLYLKHVGLLGAVAPAVHGLQAVELAVGSEADRSILSFSGETLNLADAQDSRFSVPAGHALDRARFQIHSRAKELCAGIPGLAYADAVAVLAR